MADGSFEEYLFKEQFSDMQLVVFEEDQAQETGSRGKRKREENKLILPAHSIVLAASSSYFKAKLENWSSAGSRGSRRSSSTSTSTRPEVLMPVPAGQLEVGQMLVRTVYQKQPQLADASHQQLLQLLLLADRYGVPKVAPAVAATFKALPAGQLEWETALAMLDLPDSCAGQEAFKDIVAVAADRLQQQLGDLEQVWADEELTAQLLSLPAAALKQLLQHEGTRVASENTVAYTVQRWYEKQEDLTAGAAAELGLMQLVRMRHCSQLYIGTVMAQNELFCACFSPQELALAVICCKPSGFKVLKAGECPVLQKYPAWSALERPASQREPLIQWKLRVSKLKAAVKEHLQTGEDVEIYMRPVVVLGRPLCVYIQIRNSGDSTAGSSSGAKRALIGLFVGVEDLEKDDAVASLSYTFTAVTAARSRMRSLQEPDKETVSAAAGRSWGFLDAFEIGAVGRWSEVEAALTSRGLVHDDGCLHLHIAIDSIL